MRKSLAGIALVCLVLASAGTAFAQAETETNSALRFNFALPGARSLAMGGAFLGLADDATAAFTNPAGLVKIPSPELSAEGRVAEVTHIFPDTPVDADGSLAGWVLTDPANPDAGFLESIETFRDESEATTSGLGYASFVYPGDRFAVALYRHELARSEVDFTTQAGFFQVEQFDFSEACPAPCTFRVFPYIASNDLLISSWGVSGAYKVWEDVARGSFLSIGVGVVLHDFSITSENIRFWAGTGQGGEGFGNASDFSMDSWNWNIVEEGDDQSIGVNAGLLWQVNSNWSVGAVYRQGPEFDYAASFIDLDPAEPVVIEELQPTFSVPHVYGVGIAYSPTDSWRFLLDYNRVGYSRLAENFTTVLPESEGRGEQFVADDADEFHFGAEYAFIGLQNPIFLRAGVWNDPDSRIRFEAETQFDSAEDERTNKSQSFLWLEGDDQVHFTFGAGISFPAFELNAAVDLSDDRTTGSASLVYRF